MFTEGHNMKITEKTFNVETGEETIIEREETKLETETRLKLEAENAAMKADLQAKAESRAALLERLGISEAEASILFR